MPHLPHIFAASDQLIDLLTAQCADLEQLLALARQEWAAVEGNDFSDLLRVVGERATLGERLEVYQRRIMDLRALLDEAATNVPGVGVVSARTANIIADIQIEDARLHPRLLTARREATESLTKVEQTRRSLGAYARENQAVPVAYDCHA